MVGMRDVAREAGVSTSTVSLVVNGNGYVSAAMADRVKQAMKRLNYVPNELARNFSRNETDLVGVIIPTIRHPFFASLTASLQRALYDQGLRTVLCSTSDIDQDVSQYVDMLRRHALDGIIMGAHAVYPPDYWSSIDRPIVAFDRFLGGSIPSVGSDHVQGGRLAAGLLAKTGTRHVVEIGGPRTLYQSVSGADGLSLGSFHIAGQTTFPPIRYHLAFEQALRRSGIHYDYIEIENVAYMDQFRDAACLAFERFPDVDAIVAPDLAAAFCAQEAFRRGVVIPDDLQIIAYDGTFVADLAGLRLTCIAQDVEAIAGALVRKLLAAIPGRGYRERDEDLVGLDGVGSSDAVGSDVLGSDSLDRVLVPLSLKLGESTRCSGVV